MYFFGSVNPAVFINSWGGIPWGAWGFNWGSPWGNWGTWGNNWGTWGNNWGGHGTRHHNTWHR